MSDYQNFSEKELKLGLWFTKHRLVIKATFLSIGFLFFGVLIFFNIQSLIDYYSRDEINKLQSELVNRDVWQTVSRSKFSPTPLRWQPIKLIEKPGGLYDFIVEVTNTNQNWSVKKMLYHFELSGWSSEQNQTYILPGQKRILVFLNLSSEDLPNLSFDSQPRIVVDNMSWKRLRPKTDSLKVSGLEAEQASVRKVAGNISLLNFILKNTSDYNYKEVEVTALLFNGTKIIAANFLKLSNILSGEEYPVSLRWFGDMAPITSWQIDLSTNLLDKNNFLKFTKDQFEIQP